MEEIQKRHRQEQKDLQARVMQKKKSATKKTRKGVNDECSELERQLKERHHLELSCSDAAAAAHPNTVDSDDLLLEGEPSVVSVDRDAIASQMRSLAVSSPQSQEKPSRKPNRQKARLARRAADQEAMVNEAEKESQDLPNLRQKESDEMRTQYASRGLREQEIRSDGHCLYAAIADQLIAREQSLMPKTASNDLSLRTELADTPQYKATRLVTAAYIKDHADDFLPFLEEPLGEYLGKIRETGEWGGHMELLALAKAYDVDINVLHSSGQVDKIDTGTEGIKPALWLSYYHHNFGLGEHYNSLRPAD
ncbi:MAG: hypothetical protein Q9174_001752 [Haloplaca sp. 1 TL-2023]